MLGAALIGALGWALAQTSLSVGSYGVRKKTAYGWACTGLGEYLARLSYDLLFILRGAEPVPDASFVYLDEKAAMEMKQAGAIWDRELHTQLLRQLTADRARAVFFDIVFTDEWGKPGVDGEFAAAMRENGRVVLAGLLETDDGREIAGGWRVPVEQIIPPIDMLRQAAAAWGTIVFNPLDGDYGVRRVPPGVGTVQSAAWKAAQMLGAKLDESPEAQAEVRWMNWYGPAGCFDNVGVNDVLNRRVKPGHFRDRIVIVGGRSTLAGVGFGKDDFRNPYSLLGGYFSPGSEVHLTALLNLLRGEWLTRPGVPREPWLVLGFGIVLGGLLPRFRPHVAALLAVLAVAGICALAYWLFVQQRVWFAWCVPAFVQTPVALGWAVGARYFIEERRRIALRNGFGHYLSPHIADRIADSDFDLKPGGTVVEGSVLFTDLEGFTPLSEQLHQPELVTEVLVKYFSKTTAHILDNDGTIINFVGDALSALWNAPLAQPDHVRMAARAACRLRDDARIEVGGHLLRTRIGLHTGSVLAGNIGSAERFDYAVVGDTVNFASRLEGLNKHLGTNVLISNAVRQRLGDEFRVRQLGEFRVVGRREPCVIYELLGLAADHAPAAWCGVFEKGVQAFRDGDLDAAERQMRETLSLRDGADGPAGFYLAHIAELRKAPLPPGWDGIVEFKEK